MRLRVRPARPSAEFANAADRPALEVTYLVRSPLPQVAAVDIPISVYDRRMARAATTADAFNAVAEPRRRQILDVLAGGERPVNDVVRELGLAQPQVSKHLRVLREVGAVDVREEGRQRLYRLNGQALKPIHDWVKAYGEPGRSGSTGWTKVGDLKREGEGDGSGSGTARCAPTDEQILITRE